MDMKEKLGQAYSFVKDSVGLSKQLDDISFAAFLVSLLPIPIVSQSAALLDRIAGDQETQNSLNDIWDELRQTNERLGEQADSIDKVQQIAMTTQVNTAIETRLNKILSTLMESVAAENSELEVLTRNWSFQAILNSLVDVDQVTIEALDHSQNVVQNTRVHAKKTQLLADESSSNVIDKSSFHGPKGSVSMDSIQTQGPISIEDSSVGFGADGSIGFGPGGMLGFGPAQAQTSSVSGTCTQCGHVMTVSITGGVPPRVQCPNCSAWLST